MQNKINSYYDNYKDMFIAYSIGIHSILSKYARGEYESKEEFLAEINFFKCSGQFEIS